MTTISFVIDHIIFEYSDLHHRERDGDTATTAAPRSLQPNRPVHSSRHDLPVILAVRIAGDQPGRHCLHLELMPAAPESDDQRWAPDRPAHLNTSPDRDATTPLATKPGVHTPSVQPDLLCPCTTGQGDTWLPRQQAPLAAYPPDTARPAGWHPRQRGEAPVALASPRLSGDRRNRNRPRPGRGRQTWWPVWAWRAPPWGKQADHYGRSTGSDPPAVSSAPSPPPEVGIDVAVGPAHSRRGLLAAVLIATIVVWGAATAGLWPSRAAPATRSETASATPAGGGESPLAAQPPICRRPPRRPLCPIADTTSTSITADDRRALSIGARALGVDVDTITAMVLADATPTVQRLVVDRLDEHRAQAAAAITHINLDGGGGYQAASLTAAELLTFEQAIVAIDLPDLAPAAPEKSPQESIASVRVRRRTIKRRGPTGHHPAAQGSRSQAQPSVSLTQQIQPDVSATS